MKKIFFVVVAVVICSSVSYARESIDIHMSGGKIIKKGPDKGQVGYAFAIKTEDCLDNGDYELTINCYGEGLNPCPKPVHHAGSTFNSDLYDECVTAIKMSIDMELTAGEFTKGGWLCVWSDGQKEEDEEEVGTFIYGYKLVMTYENPVIVVPPVVIEPFVITLYPNPVEDHFTIRFSTLINETMNVKIIDAEGNQRWNFDVFVSGDEYGITTLPILTAGIYHVICTNETTGMNAHATFVKQ